MSVRDLIDRMSQGDFSAARKEAKQISDLEALNEVRTILAQSKDSTEKKFCYWVLGDLGRNTQAQEVTDYLIERVACEKTATLRKQALDQIQFLQGASDPEYLIQATQDKNRGVRESAIQALGACTHPKAEKALIDLIECSDDEMVAVRLGAIALARIGTEQCKDTLVGLIRRLPRSRAYETSIAASLLGLARIRAGEALPLAVGELGQSRQPFPNWASMLVIEQFGNEEQIELVIGRLTTLLNKKKRQDLAYTITHIDTSFDNELAAGVSFLKRFDDPRVAAFFAFLHEKIDSLFDREKDFLAENLPGF